MYVIIFNFTQYSEYLKTTDLFVSSISCLDILKEIHKHHIFNFLFIAHLQILENEKYLKDVLRRKKLNKWGEVYFTGWCILLKSIIS